MTLDELTDEIERRAAGEWTFATRRQRRRLVAFTIEAMPNCHACAAIEGYDRFPKIVKQKVRSLYRERYGINPFILLAIEIIARLVIEWWFSHYRHVQIANELRSQGRVV